MSSCQSNGVLIYKMLIWLYDISYRMAFIYPLTIELSTVLHSFLHKPHFFLSVVFIHIIWLTLWIYPNCGVFECCNSHICIMIFVLFYFCRSPMLELICPGRPHRELQFVTLEVQSRRWKHVKLSFFTQRVGQNWPVRSAKIPSGCGRQQDVPLSLLTVLPLRQNVRCFFNS